MAKKIREYDRTNFIVVVSNYAWESYFSDDLGRTLENCGAFLIKEFMHQGARRFSNHTRTYEDQLFNEQQLFETQMFHPYAFIGIPGLPPGQAFEQLRSNQGVYVERSPFPHAELKVRLKFNNLLGMYSFDIPNKQYHRQSKFIDKDEYIHHSLDRSLRAVYSMLMTHNLTS